MKKLFFLPMLAIAFAFQTQPVEIKPIEIGSAMPKGDVKLYNVVGKNSVSIDENKGEKGTLVMFSCNTCPFVIAQEARIIETQNTAQKLKIGMVIINSNQAKRDNEDSQKAMQTYAKKQKYAVPYLMDDNSVLADAFGATRTPEVFLFDKNGKLVYHGSIDDSAKDPAAVTKHYLADAMQALADGKEIATKTSVSTGCSIKRKK